MPVTNQTEYKRGRDALAYFHNKSLSYSDYKITFDRLVEILDTRTRNKYFVQGLGMGIIESGASESQVKKGMETLALYARGRIPENAGFTQAIANSVSTNLNYFEAASFVAVESAKDVGTGLQQVGENVLLAGKFFTDYKTIIVGVILVGGFFVFVKSGAFKQSIGKD